MQVRFHPIVNDKRIGEKLEKGVRKPGKALYKLQSENLGIGNIL